MKTIRKGYNICKKSKLCRNNLKLRRKVMPQFTDQSMNLFIKQLKKNKIIVKKINKCVLELTPTQNQINSEAVGYLQNKHRKSKYSLNKETIIVSSDNYILDGHHRWAALMMCIFKTKKCFKSKINLNISCFQIDLPIRKIIKLANKFEKVTHKGFGE